MRLNRPSAPQPIETLERRWLLSAASHAVSDGITAAQLSHLHVAAGKELHHIPTSPMGRVSSQLTAMYDGQGAVQGTKAVSVGAVESIGGEPAISVSTRANVSTLLGKLESLGLNLLNVNWSARLIEGYLPLSALPAAAALPHVRSINAIDKPVVHSVGSAVNQADSAMNVSLARSMYGLTGAGVKIGVISDSVNQVSPGLAGSVKSGDLPSGVQVLQDGYPGDTDEGRAMLEEIHDTAPGASLAFASGDGGQDSMVTAIKSLQGAGCKVIVDDLGYYGEPMFQDGVISAAITQFVAAGGSYFSAIGNDGASGYLRTSLQYTTNSSNHTTWVNFAGNGVASGETMSFTVNGPVDLTLEWDNPYNGDTGKATSDLNVFIYDSTGKTLLQSATDANLSDGLPIETLNTLQPGTYQMKVQVAAVSNGATAPDMLKFVATEDSNGGLTNVQYPGIMSSAWGHGSGQSTVSVGAVPFYNAPPFSSTTPIQSEYYSSTGPIIYAFDSYGNRLSAPLVLNKPDVSGVDGVNTSFFGYMTGSDPTSKPQFFGTSAAAPNVAAIAALIDQYHPGATQPQILAALDSSATPLNGASAGAWDVQGGYGLVNAVKALDYFAGKTATPPAVQFAGIATPRPNSLTSESITFNEPVTGFDLSDLTLTRNGGNNLLTSAQTLTVLDSTTYSLGNLSNITSLGGTYVLALKSSGTGIASGGVAIASGGSITWKNTSLQTHAAVVNRRLFYNDSYFDSFNAAASAADDGAIASDKSALLPGHTASFANISSYVHGLNGIMIDIAGLPATALSASDFIFKTGNSNTTATWTTAPNPSIIRIRPGAGVGGSTRVELIWPNYSPTNSSSAIAKKWLQITVKADANTGLASNDVFYFGNAVGATGASTPGTAVTATDVSAIDTHRGSAPITNPLDVTRNGLVNYDDATVARNNETNASSALQLITPH